LERWYPIKPEEPVINILLAIVKLPVNYLLN